MSDSADIEHSFLAHEIGMSFHAAVNYHRNVIVQSQRNPVKVAEHTFAKASLLSLATLVASDLAKFAERTEAEFDKKAWLANLGPLT